MARFVINQTLFTREPRIVVDAGLRPGLHRFRLVVTDDQGLQSRADELVVQVRTVNRLGGFTPVARNNPRAASAADVAASAESGESGESAAPAAPAEALPMSKPSRSRPR